MRFIKYTVILMLFITLSCKKVRNEDIINPELYSILKLYIDEMDKFKAEYPNYEPVKICIVIMEEKKDSLININLFENIYFFRKEMDGYIDIENTKVFFYDSSKLLVKTQKLNRTIPLSLPDDNSEEAIEIFDPIVWNIKYKNGDFKIKK